MLLLLLMLQMRMPLWAAGDDDDDPLFLQSARQSATDVSITGPTDFTQGPPRQFRTGVNQLSPPLDDPISRPRSPRSAGDPIDLVTIARARPSARSWSQSPEGCYLSRRMSTVEEVVASAPANQEEHQRAAQANQEEHQRANQEEHERAGRGKKEEHQRANQEEHHACRARNSYGQARALSNILPLDNTMGRTNCVISKVSCTNPGHTSNGSPRWVRQGKMSVVVSASNARTSL